MRESRIQRRNTWRLANRKLNGQPKTPWQGTAEVRYVPYENHSKTYQSHKTPETKIVAAPKKTRAKKKPEAEQQLTA